MYDAESEINKLIEEDVNIIFRINVNNGIVAGRAFDNAAGDAAKLNVTFIPLRRKIRL